jgi:hypothetical protein
MCSKANRPQPMIKLGTIPHQPTCWKNSFQQRKLSNNGIDSQSSSISDIVNVHIRMGARPGYQMPRKLHLESRLPPVFLLVESSYRILLWDQTSLSNLCLSSAALLARRDPNSHTSPSHYPRACFVRLHISKYSSLHRHEELL